MKIRKLIATIALTAAATAQAAPITYAIDGSHTFSSFSYSHLGFSIQLSRFEKTSGLVIFDGEAKSATVDVVIETKSVNTGFAPFNDRIQEEDLLDTNQFPQATFRSTRVIFEDDKPRLIEGDLTIKGITKPVTLTVTWFAAKLHPMLLKRAIGANAHTTIKRSDFNVGKYAPFVGDDVRIDVAIEAIAQ